MAARDERTEEAANALQSAVLLTEDLRLTLHDDLTAVAKLRAALERAVAALRPREKGGH
jgi:hypothetical protein